MAADVYAVDALTSSIEMAKKREKKIGFEILIETALGMVNCDEIAKASKRNEAMSFGIADYVASTRARSTSIGGVHPDYGVLTDIEEGKDRTYFWGDPWHYALTKMMLACRANGLRPIDGPFGDIKDLDGYKAAAQRAAVLGYEGKVGDPPDPGADRQRSLLAFGRRGDQGQAHPRSDGRRRQAGQGRRDARRPAHRHRFDQDGGVGREEGRLDQHAGDRQGGVITGNVIPGLALARTRNRCASRSSDNLALTGSGFARNDV